MHWWVITVTCVCGALLIQYLCSSRILHTRQNLSIKSMALRDVRGENQRLEAQAADLETQQQGLGLSIKRMRMDIKSLRVRLKDRELGVPEPSFPLIELEDEDESPDREDA
jgi:septal ring factor EnvC (AmiA/AmiB activator)